VDGQYDGEVVDMAETACRSSPWMRFWTKVKREWGNENLQARAEYDQFLSICQSMDDFNREAADIKADDVAYGLKFRERLDGVEIDVDKNFPSAAPATTPGAAAEPRPELRDWYRRILQVHETADHLAGLLSPMYDRMRVLLFTMLFVTLSIFHVYAHPFWHVDHEVPIDRASSRLSRPVYGRLVDHVGFGRLELVAPPG
jgi:hypothetical protein